MQMKRYDGFVVKLWKPAYLLVFCDMIAIFDQTEESKEGCSERISADSDKSGDLFSKRVPLVSFPLKSIANVQCDEASRVVGSFFARRRRKWTSRSDVAAGLDFSSIPVSSSLVYTNFFFTGNILFFFSGQKVHISCARRACTEAILVRWIKLWLIAKFKHEYLYQSS